MATVDVQFYERLKDGRVTPTVLTKGVQRESSRGVAFGDGGEVPAGTARIDRLQSGPHVRRGAVVAVLGQFYRVVGSARQPPFGVLSWIELDLMEVQPEEARPLEFVGAPLEFGGRRLVE